MTDSVSSTVVQVVVSQANPVALLTLPAEVEARVEVSVSQETSLSTLLTSSVVSTVVPPPMQLTAVEDPVAVDSVFQVAEVLTIESGSTSIVVPAGTLVLNHGDSSDELVVTLVECDLSTSYFGGLKPDSTWKINRWAPSKMSATVANNPTFLDLSSAWTNRTLLNFS